MHRSKAGRARISTSHFVFWRLCVTLRRYWRATVQKDADELLPPVPAEEPTGHGAGCMLVRPACPGSTANTDAQTSCSSQRHFYRLLVGPTPMHQFQPGRGVSLFLQPLRDAGCPATTWNPHSAGFQAAALRFKLALPCYSAHLPPHRLPELSRPLLGRTACASRLAGPTCTLRWRPPARLPTRAAAWPRATLACLLAVSAAWDHAGQLCMRSTAYCSFLGVSWPPAFAATGMLPGLTDKRDAHG